MLPLLLRDLFMGNSNSLDVTADEVADFGIGGGNRTGGPPGSILPGETAGRVTMTEDCTRVVGFAKIGGGAIAGAGDGYSAGAPSNTEASGRSAAPECRKRRATTSELASASLCERNKQGANLQAMRQDRAASSCSLYQRIPVSHKCLQLLWTDTLRQVSKVLFDLQHFK